MGLSLSYCERLSSSTVRGSRGFIMRSHTIQCVEHTDLFVSPAKMPHTDSAWTEGLEAGKNTLLITLASWV